MLCSIDAPTSITLPIFKDIASYVRAKIFLGNLNSGLYMGPAKKVCDMLDACLKTNATDDQRAMNVVNNTKSADIVADDKHLIFHNLNYYERNPGCNSDKSNAVFVSCPFDLSFSRYGRALFEYAPYIWLELLVILCVIIVLYVLIKKRVYQNHNK